MEERVIRKSMIPGEYPDLNKEHAREWVAALRSNLFSQTRECLRNNNGFCCLGVVEEISGSTWVPEKGRYEGYVDPDGCRLDRQKNWLTRKAQDWLGVTDNNPIIGKYAAADLNDEKKFTFAQIADAVEANWGLKEAQPMSQVVPEVVAADTTPSISTYAKRAKRYIVEIRTYDPTTGKQKWERSGSFPKAYKTKEEAEAAVAPSGFMGGDRRIRTK